MGRNKQKTNKEKYLFSGFLAAGWRTKSKDEDWPRRLVVGLLYLFCSGPSENGFFRHYSRNGRENNQQINQS